MNCEQKLASKAKTQVTISLRESKMYWLVILGKLECLRQYNVKKKSYLLYLDAYVEGIPSPN